LESPSNAGRGGRGGGGASRPASTIQPTRSAARSSVPPPDDDIDAFLYEIDQESRGGRGASISRPQNNAPAQNARAPVQSNAAASRQAPQSAAVARPPAQSNANRASRAPVGNGDDELVTQGFEIHNNKGKWYSPPKTNKASDFRINGTTSTRVGFVHAIALRSLDDYGNPAKIESPKDFIGINMTHQDTGANVQPWIRDNGDCTYSCGFFANQSGTVRLEIKLCGNPMFDINVQVEDIGESLWSAKPILPAHPKQLFVINIVTTDGSRPEGVAPFEVQTMGDAEQLRLINNGDGTYKFQCIPQTNGHLTVQISLHGQPIRDSPVTIKVGDGKNQMKVKQESGPVEVISDTRNTKQAVNQVFDAEPYDDYNDPPPGDYDGSDNFDQGSMGMGVTYGGGTCDNLGDQDVSNDDLAALLDELGG